MYIHTFPCSTCTFTPSPLTHDIVDTHSPIPHVCIHIPSYHLCNRSVITRRNLAVSDIYMSVFGKDAPYNLHVQLCRPDLKPLTGTSADLLPHRKSQPLATAYIYTFPHTTCVYVHIPSYHMCICTHSLIPHVYMYTFPHTTCVYVHIPSYHMCICTHSLIPHVYIYTFPHTTCVYVHIPSYHVCGVYTSPPPHNSR